MADQGQVERGGAPPPPLSVGAALRHSGRGPVWRVVDAFLLLSVGGMLAVVTLQVASRAIGHSVPWTEELTRYLFIWTTFLGLAVGTRGAEHARVFIAVGFLPKAVRRWITHLYVAGGVTFFTVVANYGWRLTQQQIRNGETSPALGIGMYWVTLPITLSALLAIFALLVSAYYDRATAQVIEDGAVSA